MADYIGVGYSTLLKAIRMHYSLLGHIHDSPGGLVDGSEFVELSSFIDQEAPPDPRDARVMASTIALYETLYNSYPRILQHMTKQLERPPVFPGYFGANLIAFEEVDIISQQMQRDGWCPSELSMMFRRLNYTSIYFMSRVERPGPSKKHPMIQIQPLPSSDSVSAVSAERGERRSGEPCTKSKCSVYTLHEETYQTKHVNGCTNCYDIVADEHEISRILKNNCIPLILSIDNESESTNITLFESGPDVAYVAISHVWSDGLGNVTRSALPRCQMLCLSTLVRGLPGRFSDNVLFWIDTIGCPPDAAHQSEAQELAIDMMRQTYERADAVLVLDSWLQPQNLKYMVDTEILMRIVCSPWNSRLWTLQEGALAKELFFQFADGPYNLMEAIKQISKHRGSYWEKPLQLSLHDSIIERVQEFLGYRDLEVNQGSIQEKLLAMSHALAFRSTSVATDEALCLATLLGLNIQEIGQTPPEERMAKFWSSVGQVPLTFLFNIYPRLQSEGYCWAPQTLLRNSTSVVSNFESVREPKLGQLTPRGLSFKGIGSIILTSGVGGTGLVGKNFYAADEDSNWYLYDSQASAGTQGAVPYEHQQHCSKLLERSHSLNPLDLHGCQHIAFIADPGVVRSKGVVLNLGSRRLGIFVSIPQGEAIHSEDTGTRIQGKFLCEAIQTKIGREDSNIRSIKHAYPDRGKRAPAVDRRTGTLAMTISITQSYEQSWCIG